MKRLASICAALFLGVTAVVSCASAQTPQPAAPPPQVAAPVPTLYVINYRPGPQWLRGRPVREQGLERHSVYMHELARRGEILVAGPLSTLEGGLVIVRVPSLEAATSLMQNDPAVLEGKFIGEVSVWRPGVDPAGRFIAGS